MKLTLAANTILALALTASAGPTRAPYEKLPNCAFRCYRKHAPPLVGRVTGAWEYCRKTGTSIDTYWYELGQKMDNCKIEHCKGVKEWWDAAQWHYDLCGDKDRAKGSLEWFNWHRKSSWWPGQGKARPTEKKDMWVEGVKQSA